ncbi:MAG: hypothetical protein GY833_12745 [Aestuariibacter sp.]|nr:hypothetical protein [Aestuariibacter sp.]|tara:strand:+ start:129195 stop:129428 length:234 start_codon:yes stop_codon:yes gene_type:complete
MKVTAQVIEEALQGLDEKWVSDKKLATYLKARHLRGGKITKQDSKEGAGVEVHAFAFDELGNLTALCKDGHIRQYIK